MKKIMTLILLLLVFPVVVNALSVSTESELIDALKNTGGEIKVTGNITLTAHLFVKKDSVLDLNGNTINTEAFIVVNQKNLEIKDSGSNGAITTNNGFAIQNGGSSLKTAVLTLNSGTINATVENAYGVNNYGTFIMNDGLVTAEAFSVYLNGPMTLNGGTVLGRNGIGIHLMDDSSLVMNDGTVQTNSGDTAINLHGNCEATINGGTVLATQAERLGNAVTAFKNTNLTITGGTFISNGNTISGNGSNSGNSEGTNAIFTISGGTFTSSGGAAVYAPQPEGVTTITGGTFTGRNGVEIRAGVLNIENGTFNSIENEYIVTPNTNGVTTFGSAVSVAQHVYGLPVEVNICGGTFNGAIPLVQVNALSLPEETVAKVTMNVNNTCSKLTMNSSDVTRTVYAENLTGFITGGLYTHTVDNYKADGYVEIDTDDMKEVVLPHAINVVVTGNGTASASKETSPKNQEIDLTITPESEEYRYEVEAKDSHGNEITVSNNKFVMPDDDVTVTVNFIKKKEITVTFKVVNGLWHDGSKGDIVITLKEDDDGNIVLPEEDIPTEMIANSGYDEGFWNTVLNGEITLDDDTTFVYEFKEVVMNPETVDKVIFYIMAFLLSSLGLVETILYKRNVYRN